MDYLVKTAVPETQNLIKQLEEKKRALEGQTNYIRELLGTTVKNVNVQTVLSRKTKMSTKEELLSDWIDRAHRIYQEHKTERFEWRRVATALEKEIGVLLNYKTLWANVKKRYPEYYQEK